MPPHDASKPWAEFASRTTCQVLNRWVKHLLGLSPADFETWVERAPGVSDPAKCCPPWLRRIKLPAPDPGAGVLAALHPTAAATWLMEGVCQMLSLELDPVIEDSAPFRVTTDPDGMRVVLLAEEAVMHACGERLTRELCAVTIARTFLLSNQDDHQLKGQQKRLMFRDGFTCQAPGCTCRKVQFHHIVFRSQGGSNDDENEIALCIPCHLKLVHQGYLKISGTASALVVERYGEKFLNEMRA